MNVTNILNEIYIYFKITLNLQSLFYVLLYIYLYLTIQQFTNTLKLRMQVSTSSVL